MRFEHDPTWAFKDYRVFQIYPNEDGSLPVLTGIKAWGQAPPAIGKLEVLPPNPAKSGNAAGSAIDTKRMIMAEFYLLNTINQAYFDWPDPEPDPISNPSPVRYHDPNNPSKSTFKLWGNPSGNMVVILNRQNRGYIRGGIAPVFDLILRFEDNGGDQHLVDPPVRNQQ